MISHNLQPKNALRQDITGLRAVAVLAVTLYHVAHVLAPESTFFQGGFLGVDIFFVISGFLMTKIIITGLDRGNFSLFNFYKRRAKRICPALFVTVLLFVSVSVFILDTEYLLNTCRDALRGLGFISNFWFARQTGYFDGAATERIFLHTWSLSVEWQFYLIYPLLLILASKLLSRKNLGFLIVSLTIASFVFGCAYTLYNPVNSYFLLPSRSYELLIGALAYFYPASYFLTLFKRFDSEESFELFRNKISKQLEVTGLLFILFSLIVVDSSDGWPNVWSVLPLVGTYLCIAADNKQTFLGNVIFQKLGLWSYVIYLVHWPVIALFAYFFQQRISWELLPIILVLGVALHYGVERRRNFGWIFLACYFVLAGSLQLIIKTEGTVVRDELLIVDYPTKGEHTNSGLPYAFGNLSRPVDFILVGDSFARQYVASLEKQDLHIISVLLVGCFGSKYFYNDTFSKDSAYDNKCRDRYSVFIDLVKKYPDVPVIWAQNWEGYASDTIWDKQGNVIDSSPQKLFIKELPEIVDDLSVSSNRLYILGSPRSGDERTYNKLGKICYPLFRLDNFLSTALAQACDCKEVVPLLREPNVNALLKATIDNLPQNRGKKEQNRPVIYIDPAESYCDDSGCRIMKSNTFEPFFHDGSHLSRFGADHILRYVIDLLQEKEATFHNGN